MQKRIKNGTEEEEEEGGDGDRENERNKSWWGGGELRLVEKRTEMVKEVDNKKCEKTDRNTMKDSQRNAKENNSDREK